MSEQVTIPISIFELTVSYEKPVFRLLADRTEVVQALFDSFAGLDPNIDDLELLNAGKTAEKGIRIRSASQRITFFFGAVSCNFTKEAALWTEADNILGALDTFDDHATTVGGVTLGKKNSVLSLHLQMKTGSFKDILRPFIVSHIKQLDPLPLDAVAFVARWPQRRITIDGSAQLANGIFVQMEREFAPNLGYDEMKQEIYKDEVDMLKLLGVEEVDI